MTHQPSGGSDSPTRRGRRGLLAAAGLAGLAGAGGATGLAAPAEAATSYVPARHHGGRLLDRQARHLVGRFSYGVTPDLAHEVRRQGGARAWFDRQLEGDTVPDHAGDELDSWFPRLSWGPRKLWHEQTHGGVMGWEVMTDYTNLLLLRRMRSHRQVLETMTEFWENHFNVPATGDAQYLFRKSFGDDIRARALGTFESLLQVVTVHPAMGVYLGNAISDKHHPNENQGRELLELHTVGVGHYTEDDVKSSARILTGWWVDEWETWKVSYEPEAHWTGPVKVGSFHDPNRSKDGQDLTRRYLSYLAHHPDTARHIAYKLAVAFVRDDPPAALVQHLAHVYLEHGTAIKPVLRALVDSRAFAQSVDLKVRDPEGDLVATFRVMGVTMSRPTRSDFSQAPQQLNWLSSTMGAVPMGWPQPNGQPIDNRSWASPSRLLGSMAVHYGTAGGWWPDKKIHHRQPVEWVPKAGIRFDHLVDHLSQVILHRHSTAELLQACCESVAVKPHAHIGHDHPVVKWLMPRLLVTLLDSPAHYRR